MSVVGIFDCFVLIAFPVDCVLSKTASQLFTCDLVTCVLK